MTAFNFVSIMGQKDTLGRLNGAIAAQAQARKEIHPIVKGWIDSLGFFKPVNSIDKNIELFNGMDKPKAVSKARALHDVLAALAATAKLTAPAYHAWLAKPEPKTKATPTPKAAPLPTVFDVLGALPTYDIATLQSIIAEAQKVIKANKTNPVKTKEPALV